MSGYEKWLKTIFEGIQMSLCKKFCKILNHLGGVALQQQDEKFENGFIPTIFKPFDWDAIFSS